MQKLAQIIFYLVLFVCLINTSQAQSKYNTSSNKAIKLYEKAEEFFKKRQFDEGINSLEKAVGIDPNFTEALYRLATTYELFQKFEVAAKYYQRVIASQPDNPRYQGVYIVVANNQLREGNYEEAKQLADKSLLLNPNNQKNTQQAQALLEICTYAIEGMKTPLKFNPTILENPLNQFKIQYFPVLTGDEQTIVFTARKPDQTDDLFISYKKDGQWTEPVSISDNINTADNEGTCSISANGRVLVFTYCANMKLRNSFGGCDLCISYKVGDEWSEPENLGRNVNSGAKDTQPSLSADGKTLYFSSSRPGGSGGLDIWVSKMDESGKWLPAQNLGTTINTPGNEESPFIHANGRYLYFSSNGFPKMSYGGADLYYSEYTNPGWTTPKNLGYPINNQANQVGLFLTADSERGYYTHEEGQGSFRNFTAVLKSFEVPDTLKPAGISNYVKGTIYDAKTQEKLEAKIELTDINTKTKQSSTTSDPITGEYLFILTQGSEYSLSITRKDYAYKSIAFNYTEGKDIAPIVQDIALDPIGVGIRFTLNNIFFDYNSFALQDKSKTELDELVKFMQENPKVKGEISGHTDNVGDRAANDTLSLKRAQSVFNYLVEKGVASDRLKYQGYGDRRPAESNATEEGRAKNRRIEFEIL